MPDALVIFFATLVIWSFQVKHPSIIIPRKVILLTCSILFSFMLIDTSCFSFLLEDLNTMNFVFLVLSDNLLTFNHSAALLISVFV